MNLDRYKYCFSSCFRGRIKKNNFTGRIRTMFHNNDSQNTEGPYASYMRTWLMMKISAQNAPSLFGRRRLAREWKKYAAQFGLDRYAKADTEEKQRLEQDWKSFLKDYSQLCLNDHTYGSTLFGLIPLKSDSVEEKLRGELATVTKIFPERLGLEALFEPLARMIEEPM